MRPRAARRIADAADDQQSAEDDGFQATDIRTKNVQNAGPFDLGVFLAFYASCGLRE